MRFLPMVMIAALALPVLGSAPLEVTSPADGTVLRGGSITTIAWKATSSLPGDVVEWEAFLSVDGGRYYGTRITPHLDIDITEFEWRVPNVTSNDVRLMIRIGDEREETSVDIPLRLAIVADLDVRPPPLAQAAPGRGESARPGDPGVVEWAAGDRHGHVVGHLHAPLDSTVHCCRITKAAPKHRSAEAPVAATVLPALDPWSAIAAPQCARASSPLLARDILVLVRRRNI